jgi:hypothetical protein
VSLFGDSWTIQDDGLFPSQIWKFLRQKL